MRALLFVAITFFILIGGCATYFRLSGPGHEYDLKYVLPIDTRNMPRPAILPTIASASNDAPDNAADGRAIAEQTNSPVRPPFRFNEARGSSELRAQE